MYVSKNKYLSETILHPLVYNQETSVKLNFDFSIKSIRELKGETWLIDPTIEELKKFIDLNKSVNVIFTYIEFDFQYLLKEPQVKKIIIYSLTDELFLKQRKIKKFERIDPTVQLPKVKNLIEDRIACFTPLEKMTDKHIDQLIDLVDNFNIKIDYLGIKKINSKTNYNKMLRLIYSNLNIIDFPVLNFEDVFSSYKHLIHFQPNKGFPIEVFQALRNGHFVYYFSDYYKNWIHDFLINPTPRMITSIMNDQDNQKETSEKQNKILSEVLIDTIKESETNREQISVEIDTNS